MSYMHSYWHTGHTMCHTCTPIGIQVILCVIHALLLAYRSYYVSYMHSYWHTGHTVCHTCTPIGIQVTLCMCVYVEAVLSFSGAAQVMQATEDQVCLKKFLSLQGLRLLWSWLVDSADLSSSEILQFRIHVRNINHANVKGSSMVNSSCYMH